MYKLLKSNSFPLLLDANQFLSPNYYQLYKNDCIIIFSSALNIT
jgi:hypothetical protein